MENPGSREKRQRRFSLRILIVHGVASLTPGTCSK